MLTVTPLLSALFFLVVDAHRGENKHYRDEEVDVALDAFDGKHGDRNMVSSCSMASVEA